MGRIVRRVVRSSRISGDLNWFTVVSRPPDRALSQPDRVGAKRVNEFFFHLVAAPKMKLFRAFVVFVDRPAVGAAKLHSVGNNSRQHGFEVQSRADRLTDFAQGFELSHRARQIVGSLLQFFKQPHVLDGDHAWSAKVSSKSNLLFSEGSNLSAPDVDEPDGDPLSKQRRTKDMCGFR